MHFISSARPPTAPATCPTTPARLYDSLDATPKFLGHVRYGVIALGDRTYLQTFCFGGKKFDERLQGLGAQRIGEVWCHDASAGTMPEEEGTAWCREWLTQAPGRREGHRLTAVVPGSAGSQRLRTATRPPLGGHGPQ